MSNASERKPSKPLGATEAAALKDIANGVRVFGGHRQIMALHKLAARGWIEVEIKMADVERRRSYSFGRHTRYDRGQEAGAYVKAPRIESAIKRHGLATFLRGIEASPKRGRKPSEDIHDRVTFPPRS